MAARIGIDFGTTNTVVALSDRGNYPVVALSGRDGVQRAMPTLIAWRGKELRLGWEALAVWEEPGWHLLGSPKRYLGLLAPRLPDCPYSIEELVGRFFRHLRREVAACSHLDGEEVIEAMIGVPANANSLQRLRTLEAAKEAGFRVLGLLHEPTAAAMEYAHRNPAFAQQPGRGRRVLVYDLGGGTFDVALVRASPEGFVVDSSAGIERLGGDDFDRAMAELAVEAASPNLLLDEISWNARQRLLLRCREAKEALRPTARRWLIDLNGLDGFDEAGEGEVAVSAAAFADRCAPLVERSLQLMGEVVSRIGNGHAAGGSDGTTLDELDALLLCGGASQLPLVQKRLKEVVGARLKISPHPFAATAIGLAIHAERHRDRPARQRFARHFGVWREAEAGARPSFDTIFTRDTTLPPPGEVLTVRRTYHPAHNIGHFRFEECAALGPDGGPAAPEESTRWCEIRFPYDPALSGDEDVAVERTGRFGHLQIEERYECDSAGQITVRLRRQDPPLQRSYLLYGPEQVPPLPAPAQQAPAPVRRPRSGVAER